MTDTPPPEHKPSPWYWPDARGWCAAAVFALTVMILCMIRQNPALLSNASFMQLVGSIAGAGGLGLVLAFHFGSSSGTVKANERADKATSRADAATATTVTVAAPSEVTVSTPDPNAIPAPEAKP